MNDHRGSSWRKWDLHVHTPDSLVHHYNTAGDTWEKFIDALSKLPPEFKVLGINDYIFLDGYKKVLAAKTAGKLPNIDLLLPVIELRLDKFGGSKSGLSRVNFHVIFSDELPLDTIESQFLSALRPKYILSPEMDALRKVGQWSGHPTRQSLEDLGTAIISSVPEEERGNYDSPLKEGFNNLCISLDVINQVLESPYFIGKVLTGIGKTEWADIKWNDQSIADKKTIINSADLVFISSQNVKDWGKAKKSLAQSGVNDRLLDCSDAHRYADSENKDRLGKCFTWVKADPTFEGLRQALFEYPSRICISEEAPLEPFLQIKSVTINLPEDTSITRGYHVSKFCFSGKYTIPFSPYLTCIIGGRGAGKSTFLNLLHEKLAPNTPTFFRENKLSPSSIKIESSISIDGIAEQSLVEFLQQNEIEQFASDHERLTAAIFTRLSKLDSQGVLEAQSLALDVGTFSTEIQRDRLTESYQTKLRLAKAEQELNTQKTLTESIQNQDYQFIISQLTSLSKEHQKLISDKSRLEKLKKELLEVCTKHEMPGSRALTGYEEQIKTVIKAIQDALSASSNSEIVKECLIRESELAGSIDGLKLLQDEFLRKRGLSKENLTDIGLATERMAKLEQEIDSLKIRYNDLNETIGAFKTSRDSSVIYSAAIEALLKPINESLQALSTEVRPIKLTYTFDEPKFRHEMLRYLTEQLGQIETRSARIDYVESRLKNVDFTKLETLEDILSKIPDDPTVYSKTIREFLANGINFELLKLQSELLILRVKDFARINIFYDNKPIESSSFGQRCTAVIVILLQLGNAPIVIDEPEAHLDSSLIAKYLVELIKIRKNHRQIIFSTHNANFVINGDSELIHCLSMSTNGCTNIDSITIENLAKRSLLLALEGGEKAFQQRERRYGM